jgi:hypothetical protein
MPRRKGGFDCLRKIDRYADPINLTFNTEKKFRTPCGGILTLIAACGLMTWFGIQILHTVVASYSTSTTTV